MAFFGCPQVPLNPELANPEETQSQEQEKIDTAEPLNEEQQKEKENLLQQVFNSHIVHHC